MPKQIMGAPVKEKIEEEITSNVEKLKKDGKTPQIAVLRIGNDAGDKYYEKSIIKQSTKLGLECTAVDLEEGVSQETAEAELRKINDNEAIDAIIMMMPFPKSIDGDKMIAILNPKKDIDAITNTSYASLFSNKKDAFFACTAEACMEILKFQGIDLTGKKVTILGRSLRVGKPLMLMMMNENATVTVCHTRTRKEDMIKASREADIVVLATGQIKGYDSSFFTDGQIIVDVGVGADENGKISGDLNADDVASNNELGNIQYTPVPGGVGAVTTAVLLRNAVNAAKI